MYRASRAVSSADMFRNSIPSSKRRVSPQRLLEEPPGPRNSGSTLQLDLQGTLGLHVPLGLDQHPERLMT
jgi:hypothetical protein